MPELIRSILGQVRPTTIVDIAITSLLIYWFFSLIRGTRAVRLVIGVTVLYAVYAAAQALELRLLTQILQTGAVVGLFALVVVFQPELRRGLDRIGRVGSLAWLFAGPNGRPLDLAAATVARAAGAIAVAGHGALIVLERETALGEFAETGVPIGAELSSDLLQAVFTPPGPLHDGAVLVRGGRVLAAGVVLPLAETTVPDGRVGTRHRAAIGITEQSDALAVVVSEETGQIALVERGKVRRNLTPAQLERAIGGVGEARDRLAHHEPGAGLRGRLTRLRGRIRSQASSGAGSER